MRDVHLLELAAWDVHLLELAAWGVHLLELAAWDVHLLELAEWDDVHLLDLVIWYEVDTSCSLVGTGNLAFDRWHLWTRYPGDDTFERVQVVPSLELATWNDWLVTSLDQTHWGWHFWKGSSYSFVGTCHLKWLISDISRPDTLGWHFWKSLSRSFVGVGYGRLTQTCVIQCCICMCVVYAWMCEFTKVSMRGCMNVWMWFGRSYKLYVIGDSMEGDKTKRMERGAVS